MNIETNCANVNWSVLSNIYEVVGLGKRDQNQLKNAFTNSASVAIAFHDGTVVGAGRAISDDEYYAMIFDVAVEPKLQRQGIGKKIMLSLLEQLEGKMVYLTSTMGKQPFYQHLGFRNHKTAMGLYPPHKQDWAHKYLEM